MFRKMRRHKQQLSQEETAEILKTGRTAVLGILGDDGYPYTVPINYVYADGKVYFHGADPVTIRCDQAVRQSFLMRD